MTAVPIQCFIRCNAIAVRLENIVHLDSMLVDWHFFGPTRLEVQAALCDIREALLESALDLPELGTANTIDDVEEALHSGVADKVSVLGFLVKARQPYFQIDGQRLGYSWELSRYKWFHAIAFEDALEKVCTWGQAFHDEAWARARVES
jgi:hypothetical protein